MLKPIMCCHLLIAALFLTVLTPSLALAQPPTGAKDLPSTLASQPDIAKTVLYPITKAIPQSDRYHDKLIDDPFRWLEDVDSVDTKDWVVRQNAVTFEYLKSVDKRNAIKERLTELWNYERFGFPSKHGNRYLFTHNNGLQNQSVLYVADGLDAPPRVLLDPNTLVADGTVALSGNVPSDDGKLLAYALASRKRLEYLACPRYCDEPRSRRQNRVGEIQLCFMDR